MKNSYFYNIDLCVEELYKLVEIINNYCEENKNNENIDDCINDVKNIIDTKNSVISSMYILISSELIKNKNITKNEIKEILIRKLDEFPDNYIIELTIKELIDNFNNTIKNINNETENIK